MRAIGTHGSADRSIPNAWSGSRRATFHQRIVFLIAPSHTIGRMTIWLRRCEGFAEEAEADREFWSSMTPDERVAVVEQMRRDWWTSNGRRDGGLRRVVRVLRESRG